MVSEDIVRVLEYTDFPDAISAYKSRYLITLFDGVDLAVDWAPLSSVSLLLIADLKSISDCRDAHRPTVTSVIVILSYRQAHDPVCGADAYR